MGIGCSMPLPFCALMVVRKCPHPKRPRHLLRDTPYSGHCGSDFWRPLDGKSAPAADAIASNTRRGCFVYRDLGTTPAKGFGLIDVPTRRLVPFHDPKIIPARPRRIDLYDHFRASVTVDIADAERSTAVRQAGTLDIRLKGISGRRKVRPASRSWGEFHHPKVIPTRIRCIDLNDDLGAAVAIDVADADRATGVRQAGPVESPLLR
jgi:hypothetical protein